MLPSRHCLGHVALTRQGLKIASLLIGCAGCTCQVSEYQKRMISWGATCARYQVTILAAV